MLPIGVLAILGDETQYKYLGNGAGSMTSLRMIIIGIFIGLAIGVVASVFNKRVLGDFVRRLLSEQALSDESAKTLEELDYASNIFIRYSVCRGVNLRRVVKCREEEAYLAEIAQKEAEYAEKKKENRSLPKFKAKPFRVRADEHHFYIPEESKYMAEIKFEKKGSSWLGALIFLVVLAIALTVILLVLPSILSVLDGWFGSLQGSGLQ